MDPYNHLDSSRLPIYNPLTTLDDEQTDGQAHQITRLSNTLTLPPGAGLDYSRRAENSLLQPTAGLYLDYSSPEPSPHSLYYPSDGSDASPSAPSTGHSISPVPRPSLAFNTRASFVRKS
jgi:hypothetical protein